MIGLVHSFSHAAPQEPNIAVAPDTLPADTSNVPEDTVTSETIESTTEDLISEEEPTHEVATLSEDEITAPPTEAHGDTATTTKGAPTVFTVPFYSQFSDISSAKWQKVGCGIASLAMIIEFYVPDVTTVDTLLNDGIDAGAYVESAGWSHSGLINLSKQYGFTGSSNDFSGLSMERAFSKLTTALSHGPVMASVHYTFDPENPIPHLVVVNGVQDGMVYYNDPAEPRGGGTVSITQFQSAWKKRYIEIHPLSADTQG